MKTLRVVDVGVELELEPILVPLAVEIQPRVVDVEIEPLFELPSIRGTIPQRRCNWFADRRPLSARCAHPKRSSIRAVAGVGAVAAVTTAVTAVAITTDCAIATGFGALEAAP